MAGDVDRLDPLSPEQRSERMSRVRGTGNRSTEGRVEAVLLERGLRGWTKHPKDVLGRPDFFFAQQRVALFADGCFWHACPRCGRLPKSRIDFWAKKIDQNRRRDNRVQRALRRQGFHVMHVWEHEIRAERWVRRLERMLDRGNRENSTNPAE
jgi:DNA mismatch endonuclease (patch repair protein)